jgi:hypothetical protein
MKKLFFIFFFLTFFGFLIFADTEPEEIGSLFFLPDSSNRFTNEEQARNLLDNAAEYLLGKNLNPGQIHVQGYAAAFVNQIEPTDISQARALFVINELQKRGIPNELFSDPVGYGEVDLWGSNSNEVDRGPNRRVRILLEGNIPMPTPQEDADTEIQIEDVQEEELIEEVQQMEELQEEKFMQEKPAGKSRSKFPWIILLLLLAIAALLFFLSLFRKKAVKTDTVNESAIIKEATAGSVAESIVVKDLYDEILFLAYELYLGRKSYGLDEDAEADWHRAVIEVCARYEAKGYETYPADRSWLARRTLAGNNE